MYWRNEVYRVLLIDDDLDMLSLIEEYLKGMDYAVDTAPSVKAALECILIDRPDCIVMDVMMPETDGFDGISDIKAVTDAPVLFLTGKADETDRIKGLSLGADDYIVKPCSLQELSLRIKIHIRKNNSFEMKAGVMEFLPLRIELMSHKAYYNDEEIPLSNREFDMLTILAKNNGRAMTFEELGNELFGTYLDSDRKNVMVCASRLRKKLEGYVGLESMIETVWGKGYCFKWRGR